MPASSKPITSALLLFGGTGFVGTAILAEALSQDENLHIFVVSRSGTAPSWLATKSIYQPPRLHFLKGDLLNPQTVRTALRSVIPDYYKGKRKIERFIEADLENKGNAVCQRAGFVVGTRRTLPGLPTSITVSVPLAPIYRGLDRLCPTIAVEDVAAAAVRFVLAEEKAESVLVPNDAIPTYFKFSSQHSAL